MKILKKTAIVILSLLASITIISLFFPTDIMVKRDIKIDAPITQVFSNVNSMKNWSKWGGPWHEPGMDYNQVIQSFKGAEQGVGSILIYNQGDGNGSVQIIESEAGKRIKTLITFAVEGTANGEWTFEPQGDQTKVTWGLHVGLGYNPIKRIMGNLLMGSKVGPLFEIGLANLKKASE